MEDIEKIYLSGDGGAWIKQGLGWIKGSIYVLDRFHLSKYVKRATSYMPWTTEYMWNYINRHNRKNVVDLFTCIIKATEKESKLRAVKEAKRYILNNWEGIKNQSKSDYIGCSAEGHISHILSSRLSSRPLGWSKVGVDQMARLRVFKANGGKVYDFLLEKKRLKKKEEKLIRLEKKKVVNYISSSSYESMGNIQILNTGKRTWTFERLKALRGA